MRVPALALLVALVPGVALAQDGLVGAIAAAKRDGFVPITSMHPRADSEFGRELDRFVVRPWMRLHARHYRWNFAFLQMDVDGDGDGDVVIKLRTSAHLTNGADAPVLVSYFEAGGWSDAELYSAVSIMTREPQDRAGVEVAFVGESGIEILER